MDYRIALFWVALTAGPLLLAVLVALNLRLDSATGGFLSGVPHWLPWLVYTIILALGYRLIPYRPVRLRHALAGAGFAALLLEVLKWGMARYVYAFPTYEVVYGAFSVLPVFLLWVYLVWAIVLIGALLAANLGFADTDAIVIRGPAAEFERARAIVERIARKGPGDGIAVSELGGAFGHNAAVADRVGGALARLGYIIRVWPVRRGTVPNYVWYERWIGSPHLPQMSLRSLRDDIWLRGRLYSGAPGDAVMASDPPDAELLDEPIGRRDD
jgi:membrane protein